MKKWTAESDPGWFRRHCFFTMLVVFISGGWFLDMMNEWEASDGNSVPEQFMVLIA